ncbi:MAG TPA: hydrogen gas-evolving membrane-bound hydrogenase subunit E, partial [Paracoccaceae bacterium]|nr:hydrogen gas-evolving membrane-bound hydrogenase subunit E [Paracoccaceae bacterium]
LPLAAALVVTAAAAPLAMMTKGHVAFLLVLSFVGMGLALAFALAHAPDVALVLAIVETILTLLFVAVMSNMPHEVLVAASRQPGSRRSPAVGILAGVVATATAWLALSLPPGETPTAEYVRLTEAAHGKDVVTVILADFRGLDTAGELTVVVVAIIGAATIWAGTRK